MDAFVQSQQDACVAYKEAISKAMDAFEQGRVRWFCDSGAESIPSHRSSSSGEEGIRALGLDDGDESGERPKKSRKKKRKSIE